MPINTTNELSVAFKTLTRLAHTDANRSVFNESNPTNFGLSAVDIFADVIPGTPPFGDTSTLDYFPDLILTKDNTTSTDGSAWITKITPGDLGSVTLANWVGPSYGGQYQVRIFEDDGFGAKAGEIFPFDAINWNFDYGAGVLFVQNPGGKQEPFHLEAHRYRGNFMSALLPGGALAPDLQSVTDEGNTTTNLMEIQRSTTGAGFQEQGARLVSSDNATAGAKQINSPQMRLRGASWDGGASQDRVLTLQNVIGNPIDSGFDTFGLAIGRDNGFTHFYFRVDEINNQSRLEFFDNTKDAFLINFTAPFTMRCDQPGTFGIFSFENAVDSTMKVRAKTDAIGGDFGGFEAELVTKASGGDQEIDGPGFFSWGSRWTGAAAVNRPSGITGHVQDAASDIYGLQFINVDPGNTVNRLGTFLSNLANDWAEFTVTSKEGGAIRGGFSAKTGTTAVFGNQVVDSPQLSFVGSSYDTGGGVAEERTWRLFNNVVTAVADTDLWSMEMRTWDGSAENVTYRFFNDGMVEFAQPGQKLRFSGSGLNAAIQMNAVGTGVLTLQNVAVGNSFELDIFGNDEGGAATDTVHLENVDDPDGGDTTVNSPAIRFRGKRFSASVQNRDFVQYCEPSPVDDGASWYMVFGTRANPGISSPIFRFWNTGQIDVEALLGADRFLTVNGTDATGYGVNMPGTASSTRNFTFKNSASGGQIAVAINSGQFAVTDGTAVGSGTIPLNIIRTNSQAGDLIGQIKSNVAGAESFQVLHGGAILKLGLTLGADNTVDPVFTGTRYRNNTGVTLVQGDIVVHHATLDKSVDGTTSSLALYPLVTATGSADGSFATMANPGSLVLVKVNGAVARNDKIVTDTTELQGVVNNGATARQTVAVAVRTKGAGVGTVLCRIV